MTQQVGQQIGMKKLRITGSGTFTMPEPKQLTRQSEIGDYVKSTTVGGEEIVGLLKEWDSNVAVIDLMNGRTRSVEC